MSAQSVARTAYVREKAAIIYRKSAASGICTRCHIEFAAIGKKSCQPCLDRKAQYQMEVKARKRAVNPRGLNTLPPAVERRRRNRGEESVITLPVTKQVWELPWNGKHWYDMPGDNADMQKMNFFFFRRGMYDPSKDIQHRWAEKPDMFNFDKFQRS